MNTQLLTVKECQERLKIGHSRLYQLLNSGEIKSIKIGRSRRIPEVELLEFIERKLRENV